MPDGDRFERKLRVKGWRSVYRLGCSGAPINAVADRVMGAAANVFRTGPIESVRKIFTWLGLVLCSEVDQTTGDKVIKGYEV